MQKSKKKGSAGSNVMKQESQPCDNGLLYNNNPHPVTRYESNPFQQTDSTQALNMQPLDGFIPQFFAPELYQHQQLTVHPANNIPYFNQSVGSEFHQFQEMASTQNANQVSNPTVLSI